MIALVIEVSFLQKKLTDNSKSKVVVSATNIKSYLLWLATKLLLNDYHCHTVTIT